MSASARTSREGTSISRSILLGADSYDEEHAADALPLGIGRNAVLDRVIVDKNARIGDDVKLVNNSRTDHLDGDSFHIRNGIIIVPKGAIVAPGTSV